jgi:hypothetical protein
VTDPGLWHACGTTAGPYPGVQRVLRLLMGTTEAVLQTSFMSRFCYIVSAKSELFANSIRWLAVSTINEQSWFGRSPNVVLRTVFRRLPALLSQDH